jgi:predicted dehydrogenase
MAQNDDLTRRDVMKLAGTAGIAAASVATAAAVAGPGVVTAHAQSNQIKYGLIGTGSRGTYLLSRLASIDNGRCTALCDLDQNSLDKAAAVIGTNPKKYNDYRELLASRDIDAVVITVPLYEHFPVTRDALQAGKHVFCEKSLVFRPEEVHALRGLAPQYGKQVLQVGLQRRYSHYFQATRQMVEKGILGDVTHVQAMWHRNPGWVMRPGGKSNPKNWRLFREYSGGLTAELASHQIDVANWMFGAQPEFVMGLGGLDTWKDDGREIFDNIQLIFQYPGGRKMTFSAISTNNHCPFLGSSRPEFGICIMGTAGAVEINVGDGQKTLPTALWYREPRPTKISPATEKTNIEAGATFALAGPQKGIPIKMPQYEIDKENDSFITRELKYARLWLYQKGVMIPEEEANPVDTQLRSFFHDSMTGGYPKAGVDVGLEDSTAVILANIAMDENRRVYFNEIQNLGKDKVGDAMKEEAKHTA